LTSPTLIEGAALSHRALYGRFSGEPCNPCAAASLAQPDLRCSARPSIPDNHPPQRAAEPTSSYEHIIPLIRTARRYNARVQRADAEPQGHHHCTQRLLSLDARALYRDRSRCNELLDDHSTAHLFLRFTSQSHQKYHTEAPSRVAARASTVSVPWYTLSVQ
jgi:hypothetical protein